MEAISNRHPDLDSIDFLPAPFPRYTRFKEQEFAPEKCLKTRVANKNTVHPPKSAMEPENELLEEEIPFGDQHFQVPC